MTDKDKTEKEKASSGEPSSGKDARSGKETGPGASGAAKKSDQEILRPKQKRGESASSSSQSPGRKPPVIEGDAEEISGQSGAKSAAASTASAPKKDASAGARPSATETRPGSGGASPPDDGSKRSGAGGGGGRGGAVMGGLLGAAAGAIAAAALLWVLAPGLFEGESAAPDLGALEERIASLEGTSEGDASMAARLAAVETMVAEQAEDTAALAGQPAVAPQRVEALGQRLSALEGEVGSLAETLEGLDPEALRQRLAALEEAEEALPAGATASRLNQLETTDQAFELALDQVGPRLQQQTERLSGIEARLSAVEAEIEEPSGLEQAALALAVADLSRAAERAGPFERELSAVRALKPADTAYQTLLVHAEGGVPTAAELTARFPLVVERVLAADREGEDAGFFESLAANAAGLVTIRRTGEVEGDTTDAILARMERRLELGDFEAAVEEGASLDGAAAEAARPWMEDARNRLALNDALDDLSGRLLAGISQPVSAGGN